jgi:hypothetical protein
MEDTEEYHHFIVACEGRNASPFASVASPASYGTESPLRDKNYMLLLQRRT